MLFKLPSPIIGIYKFVIFTEDILLQNRVNSGEVIKEWIEELRVKNNLPFNLFTSDRCIFHSVTIHLFSINLSERRNKMCISKFKYSKRDLSGKIFISVPSSVEFKLIFFLRKVADFTLNFYFFQ